MTGECVTGRPTWTVRAEPVTSPEAAAVLRAYLDEVASRWYGRPATEAELDRAVADDPVDGLAPPAGVFLLGRYGAEPGGCAGVRLLSADTAELKRMYVRPGLRGSGGSAGLLAAAEAAARGMGARRIRLDTRLDLVEAVAFYRRSGFVEIPAYNEGPYAQIWFEKRLD
ncbi:GNAT family N-acetyltransferase [Streptomyces sp. Ru73]|uniref:GNAT family N-acetyltransferase n=1 Tax=Streptomyces sp. Ru73 TaxID=2080748 RepID=UPI000CDD00AA|nr:GNAT family N-acetyltransferase [Streptomyces sp. Ru73]POX36974.1 GNAT family N-acetyltransferase [Streptomyces sp. Ru73]